VVARRRLMASGQPLARARAMFGMGGRGIPDFDFFGLPRFVS